MNNEQQKVGTYFEPLFQSSFSFYAGYIPRSNDYI